MPCISGANIKRGNDSHRPSVFSGPKTEDRKFFRHNLRSAGEPKSEDRRFVKDKLRSPVVLAIPWTKESHRNLWTWGVDPWNREFLWDSLVPGIASRTGDRSLFRRNLRSSVFGFLADRRFWLKNLRSSVFGPLKTEGWWESLPRLIVAPYIHSIGKLKSWQHLKVFPGGPRLKRGGDVFSKSFLHFLVFFNIDTLLDLFSLPTARRRARPEGSE